MAAAGEGWYLPVDPAFLSQWGVRDEMVRAWAGPRLTAFPFRCRNSGIFERLSAFTVAGLCWNLTSFPYTNKISTPIRV